MAAGSTWLLIVNPVSGRGRARRHAALATRVLAGDGRRLIVRETTGPGDAARLAGTASEDVSVVIVAGGDGTLNEVIGGLARPLPLGIIPSGTANMVARELRIPLHPREAARGLGSWRPRPLDLPTANGKRFLGCAGVGIDADVVRDLAARRRGAIRLTSYAGPTLRRLATYHPPHLSVTLDGLPLGATASGAIVCNTRNYGGWFAPAPAARPDDGWLDVSLRTRRSRSALVAFALAALLGRPVRSALYRRCRSLRIEAEPAAPVQVDGDPHGLTPLVVALGPEQALVLAPEPAGGPVETTWNL